MSSEDGEEGEVDPRVKIELDTLNGATDEINRLETELSAARCNFAKLHNEAKERMGVLVASMEKWIVKARPYYDVVKEAKQADESVQLAVDNFHRTNGEYRAAKETIKLAEEMLNELGGMYKVDTAWQETINRNVDRLRIAEEEKNKSEKMHEQARRRREVLAKRAHLIRKKHKRSMEKSRDYFEAKEKFEAALQGQRRKVEQIQGRIEEAKLRYKNSLKNLELISTEIHQRRMLEKSIREMAQLSEERRASVATGSDDDQLDTAAPHKYDMNDLEADLKNFDFDDLSSDLSSDEDEGDSFSDTESERKLSSSSSQHQQRSVSKRRLSKQRKDGKIGVKMEKAAIPEENAVFTQPERRVKKKLLPPPTSLAVTSSSSSPHDVTDSLHGVHVTENRDDREEEEFDIFDDLC